MERGGSVYIITNKNHTTLYIGVTSNLIARISEHRNKKNPKSFSARYNLEKLVYYESFHSIEEAIVREKKLKGWVRRKKEDLLNSINPEWKDLYEDL
ncbi:MAG: GIY-YIG nuclease family protein [Bacteroidota bacterium]|nr:GIY-YIG nuclease family protein [Bacteroidota bacterium]